MEYRLLGRSGLKVSTMTMGTMTFGGKDSPVGTVGLAEAKRQIAICLDAGVNLIDTADVYSPAPRRGSSARRSARSAATCSSPPRRGFRWAPGRTTAAIPAIT